MAGARNPARVSLARHRDPGLLPRTSGRVRRVRIACTGSLRPSEVDPPPDARLRRLLPGRGHLPRLPRRAGGRRPEARGAGRALRAQARSDRAFELPGAARWPRRERHRVAGGLLRAAGAGALASAGGGGAWLPVACVADLPAGERGRSGRVRRPLPCARGRPADRRLDRVVPARSRSVGATVRVTGAQPDRLLRIVRAARDGWRREARVGDVARRPPARLPAARGDDAAPAPPLRS